MKKLIIYLIFPAILMNSGCKKYLEQLPDQRTQLNTPEKVSEFLVTAYPRRNYFVFAEAMSDNPLDNAVVPGTGVIDNRNIDPFFWRDVKETSTDSPTDYWNACYAAIAVTNQALEVCNKAVNPQAYAAQKGEALVARAYAHFMLVTFFAKNYDPSTASQDPGIPYVTVPEDVVIKQYERKTVAYVYEQIEKDLNEGLPLIRDNYTVPAYHFTKKAAYAFASRFFLFKKDAAKTIEAASFAFPSNNMAENLRPWLSYKDYSSPQLEAAFTNSASPGNLLLGETASLLGRNYAKYRYSVSQNKLYNTILSPMGIPLRKTTTTGSYATYSFSSTYYFVKKFTEHFVRGGINATTGTAYTMVPLITTEEVLLNRAEAYILLGNYTEALNDMNALMKARALNYTAAAHDYTEAKIKTFYAAKTSDTKEAYIMALLDLKRAEFVHEGMRWLDIKRHDLPVVHTDIDGNVLATLPAGDPRRLIQIPEQAILSGIPLNPR